MSASETPERVAVIRRAAQIIRREARTLYRSNTALGFGWTDDAALTEYQEMCVVARQLEAMAKR